MTAKEKILKAADSLFARAGFDATTTREIAEASGVNKALIHYHFNSKEGLFESVLDNYYRRLSKILVKELETKGPPREKLARMIEVYVDFLAANRNYSKMVQRESQGGKHVARVVENLEPMFARGMDLLKERFPGAAEVEMEPHQLMVSFYGMIVAYFNYGVVIKDLTGADPMSAPELEKRKRHLRAMLDMVLSRIEA